MPGNSMLETQQCVEMKHFGNVFNRKNNMEDGMKYLLQMLLSLSCNFKTFELILS